MGEDEAISLALLNVVMTIWLSEIAWSAGRIAKQISPRWVSLLGGGKKKKKTHHHDQ